MACAAMQSPGPGLMSCVVILKFLLSLEQEALHFYFAPGPAHYVAHPAMVNGQFFLFRIITDDSKH